VEVEDIVVVLRSVKMVLLLISVQAGDTFVYETWSGMRAGRYEFQ